MDRKIILYRCNAFTVKQFEELLCTEEFKKVQKANIQKDLEILSKKTKNGYSK